MCLNHSKGPKAHESVKLQVIDSLKLAGGSLEAALKNELAALPFHNEYMSDWTAEYAAVR